MPRTRKATQTDRAAAGESTTTRARSRKNSTHPAPPDPDPATAQAPPMPAPPPGPPAAAATSDRDSVPQMRILEEMVRQSRVLVMQLHEAQQHFLESAGRRAAAFEGQLADCRRELTELREELHGLPHEVRQVLLVEATLREPAPRREDAPEESPAESASPAARGWLGVTVEPAVVVAEVLPGTPAEAAGLVRGDVITGVNGIRILDAGELQELVNQEVGEEITLQLARGEEKRAVHVMLDVPAPADAGEPGASAP